MSYFFKGDGPGPYGYANLFGWDSTCAAQSNEEILRRLREKGIHPGFNSPQNPGYRPPKHPVIDLKPDKNGTWRARNDMEA